MEEGESSLRAGVIKERVYGKFEQIEKLKKRFMQNPRKWGSRR